MASVCFSSTGTLYRSIKKRHQKMTSLLIDAGCAASSKAIQGMGNCGRMGGTSGNVVEQETKYERLPLPITRSTC